MHRGRSRDIFARREISPRWTAPKLAQNRFLRESLVAPLSQLMPREISLSGPFRRLCSVYLYGVYIHSHNGNGTRIVDTCSIFPPSNLPLQPSASPLHFVSRFCSLPPLPQTPVRVHWRTLLSPVTIAGVFVCAYHKRCPINPRFN